MITTIRTILFWSSRILSVFFIGFLSLFALDVFGEYQGWELLLALFIHLIPSFVLLAATLIAWRYDLVGVVVFIGFAGWYVWGAGFDKPWSWYAVIAGPAVLMGLLYLGSWITKNSMFKNKQEAERKDL